MIGLGLKAQPDPNSFVHSFNNYVPDTGEYTTWIRSSNQALSSSSAAPGAEGEAPENGPSRSPHNS